GPLIIAVSGGTDSVALALILAELRDEFGLVLHVAHFDHRARPRSSAKDAAFVAQLADHIAAPVRVGRAERAPKNEDDARRDRYTFLRRAASDVGATAIATGHTMDDQAETVLLHLTRGSGIAGAAAMRPLRDGIARPLLVIGRAETDAICRAAKIAPREDPTNRSLAFARNRVRHRVLPELERINPQVRAALARFADAAAAIAPIRQDAQNGSIDLRALPATADARDQMLADAWHAATGVRLSARQRGALVSLAGRVDGTRHIDLPGGQALREYHELRLAPAITTATIPLTPLRLTRGTSVDWHGWRIALDMRVNGLPFGASVDSDTASRLMVRGRRPGDRIASRGKLQDVFVDEKVPLRLRDTWPLVVAGEEVIWAPGLTPGPRSGRIGIEAGPVGEDAPPGQHLGASFLSERRVASKSVRRPRGGNREHA
ncbi:MAG TPA: tRNA lysidine(34) synthetase TilS, partial [Candidatus Limnocylindrales bacterium]|nr:tRNA lysidine(34) synthetase TilS [Candidatus Limnocylindrales bacterium]